MKIKKLFKSLEKETIFIAIDPKGERIASGVVEDFLIDAGSKFVERKVMSIKVTKNEKFQDLEDSDYPYLEIKVGFTK